MASHVCGTCQRVARHHGHGSEAACTAGGKVYMCTASREVSARGQSAKGIRADLTRPVQRTRAQCTYSCHVYGFASFMHVRTAGQSAIPERSPPITSHVMYTTPRTMQGCLWVSAFFKEVAGYRCLAHW